MSCEDELLSYRDSHNDARFPKLKNIPDLLSDEKDNKIMENIDFTYFVIGETLYMQRMGCNELGKHNFFLEHHVEYEC